MRIDLYTRSVLTVIALCLLWLCATGFGVAAQQKGPVLASEDPQPVVIVGWGTIDREGRITLARNGGPDGEVDPNIPVRVIGVPPEPLNVRLPYSDGVPLPVGITRIDRIGVWAPIRSQVEGEPVRARPGR